MVRITKINSKNSSLARIHLSALTLRLLPIILFAAVGSYYFLHARANSNIPQVEIEWGINDTSNIPIGADISPPVSLLTQVPSGKMAIVISTYYASKYLSSSGVSCDPAIRCVSVSWPNFDNDIDPGNYEPTTTPNGSYATTLANFRYDHKFSVCVNKPNPVPSVPYPIIPLYTPHFKVVGNDKRFVITMLVRYYAGGDCDVNGGQSSSWYKTQREVNWYLCYNQTSPDAPGPYTDGTSRNSCFETGSTLPNGNDGAQIQGGKSAPSTGSGQTGTSSGSGTGGGGGGSSAKKQSNYPNTIPTSSAQGTKNTQPELQPSPFFDGRNYKPGSDPDTLVSATHSPVNKLAKGRYYILATAILCGVVGFWLWRWWQRQKVTPKKK